MTYVGRKIHLARLLQIDRFTGFYQLIRHIRVENFKNSEIFTAERHFVLLHFISQAQLHLRWSTRFQNSGSSDFQQNEMVLPRKSL